MENTLLTLSDFRKANINQQAFWTNDILFHLGNLTHMLSPQTDCLPGELSADSANEYAKGGPTKVPPVGRNSHVT